MLVIIVMSTPGVGAPVYVSSIGNIRGEIKHSTAVQWINPYPASTPQHRKIQNYIDGNDTDIDTDTDTDTDSDTDNDNDTDTDTDTDTDNDRL